LPSRGSNQETTEKFTSVRISMSYSSQRLPDLVKPEDQESP
jgi:hypothetical protein